MIITTLGLQTPYVRDFDSVQTGLKYLHEVGYFDPEGTPVEGAVLRPLQKAGWWTLRLDSRSHCVSCSLGELEAFEQAMREAGLL